MGKQIPLFGSFLLNIWEILYQSKSWQPTPLVLVRNGREANHVNNYNIFKGNKNSYECLTDLARFLLFDRTVFCMDFNLHRIDVGKTTSISNSVIIWLSIDYNGQEKHYEIAI